MKFKTETSWLPEIKTDTPVDDTTDTEGDSGEGTQNDGTCPKEDCTDTDTAADAKDKYGDKCAAYTKKP